LAVRTISAGERHDESIAASLHQTRSCNVGFAVKPPVFLSLLQEIKLGRISRVVAPQARAVIVRK
jgi:hypothetical protein